MRGAHDNHQYDGAQSIARRHNTLVCAAKTALRLPEGFDGIDPARLVEGENAGYGDYVGMANSHYRKPGLHEGVAERFAAYPQVSTHKAFLPGAIEGRAPNRIAWLHIDLNAAQPEVDTLTVLFEGIVPGGLIVLDDYGWLPFKAQRDAEDAFFAERGYAVLELPTGQGIVVKRP